MRVEALEERIDQGGAPAPALTSFVAQMRTYLQQDVFFAALGEPQGDGEERLQPFQLSVAEDACFAVFEAQRRSWFIGKRKTSDEISRSQIDDKDWPRFEAKIQKEVDSMVTKNQAMTPLSLMESRRTMEEHPDRIVRSRYHMRWKPVDHASGIEYEPKVRWIILGFEDADVLESTEYKKKNILLKNLFHLVIRVWYRLQT